MSMTNMLMMEYFDNCKQSKLQKRTGFTVCNRLLTSCADITGVQAGVLAGNISPREHSSRDILLQLILICRHASKSPKLHCLLCVLTINQACLKCIHGLLLTVPLLKVNITSRCPISQRCSLPKVCICAF